MKRYLSLVIAAALGGMLSTACGVTEATPVVTAAVTQPPATSTLAPTHTPEPLPTVVLTSTPASNETPVARSGGEMTDTTNLVEQLETAGMTVEPDGAISQVFLPVAGQIIRVNGEDVQVFEFDDPAAVEAVTATISPDGSSVGTSMVTWVAPPHFYKAGNLLVLYVGNNSEILGALESILGPPFVGR